MDRTFSRGSLAFALLVSCMLIVAGCASIPGPGSPTATKTPTPAVAIHTTVVSQAMTLRTIAPVTTSSPLPVATTSPPGLRYSVKTSAELGSFVVSPGERCPGAWQDGTETFSCCSVPPVPDIQANLTLMAMPLDLHVNLTDDPGRIAF